MFAGTVGVHGGDGTQRWGDRREEAPSEMTAAQRKRAAVKAAQARWGKKKAGV